ncbi:MAG: FHA domain-containing protein, partial [Desulfosarcina sp.]
MPRTPRLTVQLVHIQGPLKGQVQDLVDFPVQIGRHASCPVRFPKNLTTLSRQHARIEHHGNRFRIIDTSTNGTYVNGKRIAAVYLRDGDVITFSENGPKASFLTKIEASTTPSRTFSLEQPPEPTPAALQPQPAPANAPTTPPPLVSEPDLTLGPDSTIAMPSFQAPLSIQFGPNRRIYDRLPVTLGSDAGCDFVIADKLLTGQHAQIFFDATNYWVKDLTGSRQVTINGRAVGTQAVLAQGAELSL